MNLRDAVDILKADLEGCERGTLIYPFVVEAVRIVVDAVENEFL